MAHRQTLSTHKATLKLPTTTSTVDICNEQQILCCEQDTLLYWKRRRAAIYRLLYHVGREREAELRTWMQARVEPVALHGQWRLGEHLVHRPGHTAILARCVASCGLTGSGCKVRGLRHAARRGSQMMTKTTGPSWSAHRPSMRGVGAATTWAILEGVVEVCASTGPTQSDGSSIVSSCSFFCGVKSAQPATSGACGVPYFRRPLAPRPLAYTSIPRTILVRVVRSFPHDLRGLHDLNRYCRRCNCYRAARRLRIR